MNIAIIICGHAVESGGGVRMQGLMWREGLEKLGHNVTLVNFWDEYDWSLFDAVIVMQMAGQFDAILELMHKNCERVLFAPILDPGPKASIYRYRFLSKWMSKLFVNTVLGHILHLSSEFTRCYDHIRNSDVVLTRSQQETDYMHSCFDVEHNRIAQVPLSLRFEPLNQMPQDKELFCLHVSRLSSTNKNVSRLISAAKLYNFKLKLAGFLHGEEERQWLNDLIGTSDNIEYVGVLSDAELKDYYCRAKVFALPSITEGVGMVAMEAAAYGCEIVLTNLGAPKDYYNGLARLVNPFSVEEIGAAIVKSMNEGYSQPKLMNYIRENYSLVACTNKLLAAINSKRNKNEN